MPEIHIGQDANGCTIVQGDGNHVQITIVQERRVVPEPPAPPPPIGPNPYQGLAAFTERTAKHFFGREALIQDLWSAFQGLHAGLAGQPSTRLLAILGPSGSGKSSLIRAGLFPELVRRPLPGFQRSRAAVLTPGGHPLEALARVILRLAGSEVSPEATASKAALMRAPGPAGAHDGLRRCVDSLPDIEQSPVILVIDQFEELFTLCRDPAERAAFIANVLHAASDTPPRASVILTLRSDFFRELAQHPRLQSTLSDPRCYRLILGMSDDELRRAIAEPARIAGHPFSDDFINALIDQVKARDGALPLLQFTLTRVWEGLGAGVDPGVTLTRLGGIGGALAGEAERIYRGSGQAQRAIIRRAFLAMVSLGEGTRDTRRRAPLRAIVARGETEEDVRAVLAPFARHDARLVTLSATIINDETIAEPTVEVTHEALFDHWADLKQWLLTDREDQRFHRRLFEATERWLEQKGSPWVGKELAELRDFHRRAASSMTTNEFRFFRASSLRSNLNLAAWIVAGLALMVVAVVAVVFFLREREAKLATDDALKAERDTRGELEKTLVTLEQALDGLRDSTRIIVAEQHLTREPWLAAALLVETRNPHQTQWAQAAFDATQQVLPARFLRQAQHPMVFSEGATWLFSAGENSSLRGYPLRGDPIVHILRGPLSGAVIALDAVDDADGQRIAALRGRAAGPRLSDDAQPGERGSTEPRGGLEVWRVGADGAALLGHAPGVEGRQIQQERGGRIAVQKGPGLVELWQIGPSGLERVGLDLPCELVDRGKLLCRTAKGPTLTTYGSPTTGVRQPFEDYALTNGEQGIHVDARAKGVEVHLAWNGAAFVKTGLKSSGELLFPTEGEDFFLAAQDGSVDVLRRAFTAGEVIGVSVCRIGKEQQCQPVPTDLDGFDAVTARDVVVHGRDAWRLFDRATFTERRHIPHPIRCTDGPRIAERQGRWIGCLMDEDLWLWGLGETSNVRRIAPEGDPWHAKFIAGGRVLTVEPGGSLASHRPTPGGVAVIAKRQLAGDLDSVFFAGDFAIALEYTSASLSITWVDLVGESPNERLGAPHLQPSEDRPPIAAHAKTRRILIGGTKPMFIDARQEPVTEGALPCERVWAVAIAPDGETAAIACSGELVMIALPSLRASSRLPLTDRQAEGNGLSSIAFSPTGDALVIGARDGTMARVTRKGAAWERSPLSSPHRAWIEEIEWDAGGLVSRGGDGRVVLWAPNADGLLQPLMTPSLAGEVVDAGLMADGSLMVATNDGLAWTWQAVASLEALRGSLAARSKYCPTVDERMTLLNDTREAAQAAADRCAVHWREVVTDASRGRASR